MLFGNLVDGRVTLDANGKVIVETDPPEAAEGYSLSYTWEDDGERIVQRWSLDPKEGSREEAISALIDIVADSLSDADALKVQALYPVFKPGTLYKKNKRLNYLGTLYAADKDVLADSDNTPDKGGSYRIVTADKKAAAAKVSGAHFAEVSDAA